MSFWDIAIIIRYLEWSQLSNGYPGDVQAPTYVKFYGQNGNILKYHMKVRNIYIYIYIYVIVPLLHNELF